MLQQTRVDQGLPYYLKFLEHFPTINDLANASEDEVLSLWQGLGYYSRARNLHFTAKYIVNELNGEFPNTFEQILKLKGVGPYTAAAIASFAYKLPHPVIDGNVQRVISRLSNIKKPIDRKDGITEIETYLASIFEKNQPDIFNQAIMEFGSLVCSPKIPNCETCPLQSQCLAFENKSVGERPIKQGKTKVINVKHSYLIIGYKQSYFIEKRSEGIWKNMYQFPLISGNLSSNELISKFNQICAFNKATIELVYHTKHVLSHRKIDAAFYTLTLKQTPRILKSDIFEIPKDLLGKKYPISVLTQKFLKHTEIHDKQGNIGWKSR